MGHEITAREPHSTDTRTRTQTPTLLLYKYSHHLTDTGTAWALHVRVLSHLLSSVLSFRCFLHRFRCFLPVAAVFPFPATEDTTCDNSILDF